jgi:hypothetical protein
MSVFEATLEANVVHEHEDHRHPVGDITATTRSAADDSGG